MREEHPAGGARRAASGESLARLVAFRRRAGRLPRLEERAVTVRGLRVAVFVTPEVAGATPLVCVNGGLLFGHELLWPALAPLAARRQLVLYDQRGRGKSEAPSRPDAARIEDDAEDLAALRRALGLGRWDVLGHSWGGGIAMLGAERDQTGVRRLVLVDSVGATGAWMPAMREAALARLGPAERATLAHVDGDALASGQIGAHSAWARAIFPAWFADPSLATLVPLPRSTSETGAAVAGRLWRDGYDWGRLLRALRRPTIVIHGARDVLPLDAARALVSLLPDARLHLLPESGHLPFLESPGAFFPAVEDFLAQP